MPSRKEYSLQLTYETNRKWDSLLHDEQRRSYAGHLKNVFRPETLDKWWTTTMKNIEW